MQVAVPHELDRAEVRRRLKASSHEIADAIPGGMAQVETSWPSEDRMAMAILVMGQSIEGHIDIEDSQVVFIVNLPPALGFLEPMIAGTVREHGEKLIAPPKD